MSRRFELQRWIPAGNAPLGKAPQALRRAEAGCGVTQAAFSATVAEVHVDNAGVEQLLQLYNAIVQHRVQKPLRSSTRNPADQRDPQVCAMASE
jgi:hypothetical protein